MTEKEYITTMISEVVSRFAGVRVRYEFRDTSKSHIFEVTPMEIYESSEFKDFAFEKVSGFYESFPGTNFAFISENSLTGIKNPTIDTASEQSALFSVVGHSVCITHPIYSKRDMEKAIEMHPYYCLPTENNSDINIRYVGISGLDSTLFIQTILPELTTRISELVVRTAGTIGVMVGQNEMDTFRLLNPVKPSWLGLGYLLGPSDDEKTIEKSEQFLMAS